MGETGRFQTHPVPANASRLISLMGWTSVRDEQDGEDGGDVAYFRDQEDADNFAESENDNLFD